MNLPRESFRAHTPADVAVSPAVCGWMLTSFPTITPSTRVSTAIRLLNEHALVALPVCDQGQFVGFVDDKAVLYCTPSELAAPGFRETPAHLDTLTAADCSPQSLKLAVSPGTSVRDAATVMANHAARVIAVAEGGRLVGMLNWDSVLGPAIAGSNLGTVGVRDRMLTAFPTISPDATVAAAIHLLQTHPTPALPVCENGRLLGFVDEKGLLRLTPSAATMETIHTVRYRLSHVPIGGRFVPALSAVAPRTSLGHAVAAMMIEPEEVVPVLDDGLLVGLLSWDHVMAASVGVASPQALSARRQWLFWM
jgi:CBS domain-containing protein